MNNVPREMLVRIVAKYGRSVGDDARRCEGLLNDLCGAYRREINVLVNAVDERIPLDLLAASGTTPLELLLTRLEKRFENQTGLTTEAARWAVESWALALGAANEVQINERERRISAESSPKIEPTLQKAEPIELPENKPANQNPANNRRVNPTAPPKIQTPAPPLQTAPPITRQPTANPFPSSAPPARQPVNRQPQIQTPTPNQPLQPAQQPAAKRGFGKLRGCLLLIVFLIAAAAALVFVAPYAIETMRETQRERNNEPPRFPVR